MRRGCLIVGGVLLGLVLIGFVYLTINPPLNRPDTGYLSSSTEVDARLDASNPTAAFEVRFGAPENVYAGASGDFPPLRVSATLVDESVESAKVRLWLSPRDGLPVTGLATSEDGTQLSWQLDCQTMGTRSGCLRDALLIVSSADLPPDELRTKVRLFAEQRFPAHVPTPFLVSLDLAAESVGLASGDRLMSGAADGSHRLSPQQPVVRWSLSVDGTEAPVDGSWLTVEVDHAGVAIPTGFEAPSPVAVALVDQAAEVVGIAEVRPGSPSILALPSLGGEYTVVAWWQDRAAESYDVRWRVEQQVIGSDSAPSLSALLAQEVAPVERLEASGDFVTDESGRDEPIDFGPFETDSSPYLGPDHVPSHLAIVELHLTAQTDDAAPVVLWLDGAPIPFVSGAAVDTAFGQSVNCSGYECGSGASVAADHRHPPVNVAWDGVATLWPLDPALDQP